MTLVDAWQMQALIGRETDIVELHSCSLSFMYRNIDL